ncbi:MAG: TlpA family protein disulfide reductase [Bacteroidetes bacterium]|jgi:thiol-disulfide isomerase/thioredoxin|nr:TlpA family protein disulfide reductase [Bacteroidota bacterium]MBK7567537.1 TlpA family protein disulfide reductase [Bacteroidota bacterium]MBP8917526.1 TlpA family protein disulfide reductase [Chitinophagales bacterium]MBP9796102.1 TlpA family protein disulfide reductase [Chitinophagales bacterium]
MKNLLFFSILLYTTTLVTAQIKIGDKVELNNKELIGINDAKIEASKIIVLDFWATWCAPCIASFPHLDSIQKEYNKEVQILCLSDESIEKVSLFLTKRNFPLNFFVDNKQNTFKLFEVEGRPMTAVIGLDKTLQWVGHSNELKYVLDKMVNNNWVASEYTGNIGTHFNKYYANQEKETNNTNYYTYQITSSTPDEKYEAKTQKGTRVDSAINITYQATPIIEIVQDLLNVSDLQFNTDRLDLDTTLINLIAISNSARITYAMEKEKIIRDLQGIFSFEIEKTDTTVITYNLKIENPSKLTSSIETIEGGGMVQTTDNTFVVTRLSLYELSDFLQKKLRVFISTEESADIKYNLVLPKLKSVDEMKKVLVDTYGINLVPAEKTVTIVQIK